jgi:transcription antitermination factor NusB
MLTSRTKDRERAFLELYRHEFLGQAAGETSLGLGELGRRITSNYFDNAAQIDSLIEEVLERWKLPRLGAVERALLRAAVSELMMGTTETGVVIAEAVRLASEYSSEESPRFVNGVLSAIAQHLSETKRLQRPASQGA